MLSLELDLPGLGNSYMLVEHIVLEHENLYAVNDAMNPEEVMPKQVLHADTENLQIAPLTWNLLRFHR